MPEYYNHNPYTVYLVGPDGKTIKVRRNQRITLSEYYERYCARGFIKQADKTDMPPKQTKFIETKKQSRIPQAHKAKFIETKKQSYAPQIHRKGKLVGRNMANGLREPITKYIDTDAYPISNNIGIGILSYNRGKSLQRLVDSIIANTDLHKTTVFISDDASDDPATNQYLNELSKSNNFIIIRNTTRLGIAGNSNRLLRCLSRFKYGILMNDDVEILRPGWDTYYPEMLARTKYHHFLLHYNGVYGSTPCTIAQVGNVKLLMKSTKPQGAILAFTNTMLSEVGYFDENYGLYGMEHVDWSRKAFELGLQKEGYYDVDGSNKYFKLYAEKSAVDNRITLLHDAKELFANRIVKKCSASDTTKLPEVTYVIPCRDTGRIDAIKTVVNNIRAQRFPIINIIVVEQDDNTKIDPKVIEPTTYYLVKIDNNALFNKAAAFNRGVFKAMCDNIILHDADMLVQGSYTSAVTNILSTYESCHLGKSVVYADEKSTNTICTTQAVDGTATCERLVKYFEGGSLACRAEMYWKVGGFNEDFFGYGVEDCDFYARLSEGSKWYENRTFDFLHLWHGRVIGWDNHHTANKQLGEKLNALSIKDRITLQHAQMIRLGYPTGATK